MSTTDVPAALDDVDLTGLWVASVAFERPLRHLVDTGHLERSPV